MSRPNDWDDLGVLALQDHDSGIDIDRRSMIVGARYEEGEEDTGLAVISTQDGKGTVGDIHPWRYWAPKSRDDRPMGAWAQVFGAVVSRGGGGSGSTPTTGGGRTGPGDAAPVTGRTTPADTSTTVMAVPIRRDDYKADKRFEHVAHNIPEGMQSFPVGTLVLAVAGTEEREQEDLIFHADPRLIAVNWSPTAKMGTIVADLEPTDTISEQREARIQSAWRVLRMPDSLNGVAKEKGNGVAWQLTGSQQDALAGYGLCYGLADSSGGGSVHQGPTTPSEPSPNQGHGGVSGGGHWGVGSKVGIGPGNVSGMKDNYFG